MRRNSAATVKAASANYSFICRVDSALVFLVIVTTQLLALDLASFGLIGNMESEGNLDRHS